MCGFALARSALHLLSLVRTQHRALPSWLWMDVHRNSHTILMMRKHTVKLHGHHCEISVHREGKHIWLAVGDYLGKAIRCKPRAKAQRSSAGEKQHRRRWQRKGPAANSWVKWFGEPLPPNRDRPLIEIHYYGDRLVGCIECNRWGRLGDATLSMHLLEDDLEAIRAGRESRRWRAN